MVRSFITNKWVVGAIVFTAVVTWFFVYVTQLVTSELMGPKPIIDESTNVILQK